MSKEMMNGLKPELALSVTFRHADSSDFLRNYATEKVTQRVKKYMHSNIDAKIILSVEKLDHFAEVHLTGKDLDTVAKATNHDMYAAIDKMVDVMETQLRKHKDKLVTHRHQVLEEEFAI
jgi:putative sigma-54 modulation protein